ncbi:MAG: protein-L-isoaspartate(D-aspartate) O-methyltransferase [Flavobacteriales bacterium]
MRRKLIDLLRRKGIHDAAVLEAMMAVPRHLFIDDTAFLEMAYVDQAFPIGCGQTISQPYTVAFQTQLLGARKGDKVLEIGTGCGYQTAVLSAMGTRVVSIERHRPLHVDTKARLHRLGYKANLVYGDGFKGAPGHAPFDRILVTCGAPAVPQDLLHQLKVGGSMVVPVGAGEQQVMLRIVRVGPAEFQRDEHGVFSFVPMLADKAGG